MEERKTIAVKTSHGHIINVYEYITGREYRAITEPFLDDEMTVSTKNNEHELKGVKGNKVFLSQDRAIQSIIKSVQYIKDGQLQDEINDRNQVLDFILNLPQDDYQMITEKINEITQPKKVPATS